FIRNVHHLAVSSSAAYGCLKPAPANRLRRTCPHLGYSTEFKLRTHSWHNIALCLLALALILVPSMDTWPSFTSPASEHNSRACVKRPESASRWRLRNSAMVAWSGCWSPER